jgi:hypothetical protein
MAHQILSQPQPEKAFMIAPRPKPGWQRAGKQILNLLAASWRGAVIGAVSATFIFLFSNLLPQHLGWGSPLPDVFIAALLAALLVFLGGALADLLWLILRLTTRFLGWVLTKLHVPERWARLPYRAVKAVPIWLVRGVGGVLVVFCDLIFLVKQTGPPFTLLWMFVLLETLVGGLLGLAFNPAFRARKPIFTGLLAVPLILNLGLVVWLVYPGTDDYLVKEVKPANPVTALNIPNPGLAGAYQVKTLVYGSGTDRHRPEYGPGVNLKTSPVDASKLLPQWSGFGGAILDWVWGFGINALPINGQVWYPGGDGPFPLVLIAHGNHAMLQSSEGGYAYLGELLASRGFITVTIDENFLNGWVLGDFNHEETPVRAWLLLHHLKVWQGWNEDPASPFYQKVDFKNVALIGHSRGGETVSLAAGFSSWGGYLNISSAEAEALQIPIKAVVAIAPADKFRLGNRGLTLKDTNYLLLQGAHDADVNTIMGSRQYEATTFSGNQYNFKSLVYIYRADHSRFNTVWGDADNPPPLNFPLNQKPLLSAEAQRQIAKVYIAAFLEASLHNQQSYLSFLRNHYTAQNWLPDDIYLTQFADSNLKLVNDFEGYNPTLTYGGGTVQAENFKSWQQKDLVYRDTSNSHQRNQAVFLSWDNTNGQVARYSINLPADFGLLTSQSRLALALGRPKEDTKPLDLTVELVDKDGQLTSLPLSYFAPIQPALKTVLTKANWLEGFETVGPVEQVLQSYELPLSTFVRVNPHFDPANLKTVRFNFDRTASGEVILDNIGFYPS